MDIWEAKYKALLAGFSKRDQEYIEVAEKIVDKAEKWALSSPILGFEECLYAILKVAGALKYEKKTFKLLMGGQKDK